MLSIEQSLTERLPWLAQFPRLRRPVAGMLGRLADEDGFNRVLDRVGTAEGFDFVDRVLEVLGTTHHVNPGDLENIPAEGPLLVVANHPLGMQDALAMLQLIGSVRRDVEELRGDGRTLRPFTEETIAGEASPLAENDLMDPDHVPRSLSRSVQRFVEGLWR